MEPELDVPQRGLLKLFIFGVPERLFADLRTVIYGVTQEKMAVIQATPPYYRVRLVKEGKSAPAVVVRWSVRKHRRSPTWASW